MRKLGVILSTIIFVSMIVLPSVNAQERDPAVRGLEWLNTQQSDNGSFADDLNMTILALMAYASVGETNQAALDWVEATIVAEGDNLNLQDIGFTVTAVIASGADPNTFADGKLIERQVALLRESGGENLSFLCTGLISMINLDLPLSEVALGVLAEAQNEDGGFGESADEESNIGDTVTCGLVLHAAEQTEAFDRVLEYVKATQNEDGGWSAIGSDQSDALGTAAALQLLLAANEDLTAWGSPEFVLVGFQDRETGQFSFSLDEDFLNMNDDERAEVNLAATVLAIPVLRGKTFTSFVYAPEATQDVAITDTGIPALSSEWEPIADGFGMAELNSADDFFVMVVDPFSGDELTGVQIINWTAEYRYTGYIIENALTAEVLMWMAEQDPTTWEKISKSVIELMPDSEVEKLPEEVQALAD